MIQFTNTIGRTVRRISILTIPLLVAATGTTAAQGGGSYGSGSGSYGSGMMGGGWGLFGGGMGLWGLLWMGLLVAVLLYAGYALLARGSDGADGRSRSARGAAGTNDPSLSVLRERYARGDLSDDEFDRRRRRLEGAE